MAKSITPMWAIDADGRGLSRLGHYACAAGSFLGAFVAVLLGATTIALVVPIPVVLAPFAVVFGFFSLWAVGWLVAEAVWDRRIARRTGFEDRSRNESLGERDPF